MVQVQIENILYSLSEVLSLRNYPLYKNYYCLVLSTNANIYLVFNVSKKLNETN